MWPWREIDTNLDAYAALRSPETAAVVLEPGSAAPDRRGVADRPRTQQVSRLTGSMNGV
jgi:hypothetical protein